MTSNELLKKRLLQSRHLIAIIGTTASGKSDLAVRLAKELDGEVISLDSMQVYKGMDIGTGKMKPEEMQGVPHHLIDVLTPDQCFSAGEFVRRAEACIKKIVKSDRLPIVVGGTGLYLRAFLKGLFLTPAKSAALRKRLERWEKREGIESLHRFLTKADPESVKIIKPADRQRIHRALEIMLVTGRSPSALRQSSGFGEDRFPSIKIGLNFPTREGLYSAVEQRVDKMFKEGWIEEVERLLEKYDPDLHPFKAIGYREIVQHLQGDMLLDSAIAEIKKKTRNYAKRQVTWWKKEEGVAWFDAGRDKELVCRDVLKYIAGYLNAKGELKNGIGAE